MRDYIYSLLTDKKGGVIAWFLKLILLFLSYIYIFILALVKAGYKLRVLKSVKLDCKVISIGNIMLGGTGKTPFVNMLAKRLIQDGHKVVILIRGYKRKIRNTPARLRSGGEYACPTSVWRGMRNTETMGDEGYLLSRELGIPVLVGRDRIKTGRAAIEKYHPDIIILDDGFQHWRLHRDLDIVLINAVNPFGNGKVIPRGILREPLSSLMRADVLALTKVDLAQNKEGLINRLEEIKPKGLIIEAVHKPAYLSDLEGNRFSLLEIKDKPVCIFSAIADPDSFEKAVSGLGAKIKLKFEFCDHHAWQDNDLDKIIAESDKTGVDTLITTAKDGVKLKSVYFTNKKIRLLILNIELRIVKNEEKFMALAIFLPAGKAGKAKLLPSGLIV